MSTSLCDAFTKSSIDTWYRIQEGRHLMYPLGEETLTDLLLRDLLRLHLPDITIEAFTKKKEGINGADWEWWFGSSTENWLGLRIQAKVISHKADEFSHLHYNKTKKGATVYQCDKLITQARANHKWPCVPLYCLYSYWTATYAIPHTYCPWGLRPSASSFGCSILPATAVQRLRKPNAAGVHHRNTLADTLNDSFPLACLACWPFGPGTYSIVKRMHALLDLVGALDSEIQYLRQSPPPYVVELTRQRRNKQAGVPSRIDDNFNDNIILPSGLAGVVAITQISQ